MPYKYLGPPNSTFYVSSSNFLPFYVSFLLLSAYPSHYPTTCFSQSRTAGIMDKERLLGADDISKSYLSVHTDCHYADVTVIG
jgi:hypothetical protein